MDYLAIIVNHWATVAIASAILLLLYIWGVAPYNTLSDLFKNVPGPTPWPFVGHLLDTLRHKMQIHLQMDEYYKKYGRLYKMYLFGKVPCLVVGDPEMVKDILVKEFDSFSDRPMIIKTPEPLNSMLTAAQRDTWKRIRNTLSPAFSAHKMKQMVPLMNTCCDTLVKKLGEVADSEESVNIVKLQQGVTMDVIVSAVFGIQANSQENPDDPVITAGRQAMKQSAVQRIVLSMFTLLPFGLKIMEKVPHIWLTNFQPIIRIAEEIIRTKRKGDGTASRKDMLDLMLAASDDPSVPDAKKLSDMEVLAQSIIFLIAGYETSSTTLSLTCHQLATNPEVQDKLQREIDSVWTDEDKMPSYETVHELPYLDMVISETLRLYPPGFLLSRVCTNDCCIKGVNIPKDFAVVVPVYSMHRDPSIFPDPEKFDPERFSPEAKQSRSPYSYLPFGHGPHNCIGLRFAQMEMKLVLARIVKKYRLEVGPDTKNPPDVRVRATLSCSEIKLRVVSRAKEQQLPVG